MNHREWTRRALTLSDDPVFPICLIQARWDRVYDARGQAGVSRQNSSGTYTYFRDAALGGREFELGALSMNGSSEVVDLVENTPCAIGYSGLAYATEGVKMPCIAAETGAACVAPSVLTATERTYPIARPLYMYTAGEARGDVADYLRWILSDEGQCILVEIGYPTARPLACEGA